MFSTCSDDLRWLLDDYYLYILVLWPNRDTTRKKTFRSAHLQLSQTTNRRGLQRWHSQPETVSRSPPHIKKSTHDFCWSASCNILQHLEHGELQLLCFWMFLNSEICSEIVKEEWNHVKSGRSKSLISTRIDPWRILPQLPLIKLSCIALEEAYVLGSDGHGSEASVPVHHWGKLGWSWMTWMTQPGTVLLCILNRRFP